MRAPPGRYCIGCGFDLAGIAGGPARCPECGRGFDPGDAATYDPRPRRDRRWRLARRVAVAAVGVALVGALVPRGWAVGRLTIRAPGRPAVEVVRTELAPPGWLARATGWRYPGWTTQRAPESETGHAFEFSAGLTRVTLLGLDDDGLLRAMADADELPNLVVNGVPAAVENARALIDTVLRPMVRREAYGVSLGMRRPEGGGDGAKQPPP